MKKIVIDAFGGDNSPHEIIKGAIDSLHLDEDLSIILVGFQDKIEQELKKYHFDATRVSILPAYSVITGEDTPTVAIKEKKDASLTICFEELKTNPEVIGLISAGSTGAVLAGGFLKIGRVKGVSRPALCPFFPTKKQGLVLLLDAGANVDCKPINLLHFAVMGNEYVKLLFGIEKPRIGLLNVGTEDHKGNELIKQTFPLMKELDINFIGNMEARDIMSGDFDIVVCDGFDGNIALKATEGALKVMLGEMKRAIKKNLFTKIGAVFMLSGFKQMKNTFDFDNYSGSPFLGCRKLVIKSHGSSKSKAIVESVRTILSLTEKNLNEKIEEAVAKVTVKE